MMNALEWLVITTAFGVSILFAAAIVFLMDNAPLALLIITELASASTFGVAAWALSGMIIEFGEDRA
ncbi:MAG: hypothetical protein A3I44_03245 [Candidatus Sungbacteria bacterium RIFCSPLOWO2_02_FULL_51_17]|uniref:Uncharacterized protein n=1 Tax=Candidatus Sungbacteria bacterium RIFCSPHIGHO2_02_FULL_51_29 TaxID=1802273 RepID=A0A1G2KU22_9BACT|nr:MAG: hypothetical protein A2676_02185 [Candidatus Sungbacteria bacterium RIFCSPHIGHO2_01_FULL_51_22]OHA02853.1 MAG: hypothetical protein A3C16_02940 [Candidatus Sungbacteria bacterium RIFCSPHIGHO2_02_FULL_51_29]OHA07242.1 MAG: hypothetical protein A3B29_04350 [Candidatus Sungbacteria bacterium RIFCSPLOWO2_01_FULL_51_34]OHA11000.1 MAG: hypothetical protein A3I44_03245 [Candidatus Sungbacteria bacterium RIFCSPLOWO2_02_FULL_51_17]